MPTVCGLCPVGCNITATTREGKVKRILSRNHPEVDEGWLCDKGRFALHAPVRARPDHRPAPARPAARLRGALLGRRARRGRAAAARSGRPDRDRALRLRDGRAGLRARRGSLRAGLGAHAAVLPEETSPALDAFRLPLSAIRDAELVVVLGDEPVAERAPVVELWIKAARRARRRDRHASATRTRAAAGLGGRGRRARRRAPRERARDPDLVGRGRRRRRARRGARAASSASPASPARAPSTCRATPNGRGVADAWAAPTTARPKRRSRSAC